MAVARADEEQRQEMEFCTVLSRLGGPRTGHCSWGPAEKTNPMAWAPQGSWQPDRFPTWQVRLLRVT